MTCSYAGCNADTSVDRRYTKDGEIYSYCPEHDPLGPDSMVADVFEGVTE